MRLKINYLLAVLVFIYLNRISLSNKQDGTVTISYEFNGFHRILCYEIKTEDFLGPSSILIKQNLPKSMFIDIFQLQNRSDVYASEIIDTEIPAYQASDSPIHLCSSSKSSLHKICTPVHFRYHSPHECKRYGETAVITLNSPSVFLKLHEEFSNLLKISSECENSDASSWIFLSNIKVISPSFEVPVGCTEDFYSVLFLLTSTVGLSVLYLLFFLKTCGLK